MQIKLARDLQQDSIVDGEGIRTVVWTQGCKHDCYNCHNKQTHNFEGGVLYDVDELKDKISNLDLQDGITFSGGDPFFQPQALLELAKHSKSCGLNVWAYTGFTFEKMLENEMFCEILQFVDVLVDGKFEEANKSYDSAFRGSSNQRLIDVQRSFANNKICLHDNESKFLTFDYGEFIFV